MVRYAVMGALVLCAVSARPAAAKNPHRAVLDRQEDAQLRSETNTLRWTVMKLVRLYQKLVSPQYGDVCNFHPSCSHFGFQAARNYGPVQGGLMTADRLLRCNRHAPGHYPFDPVTGKLLDPVQGRNLWGDDPDDD